jgi:hypothetical protein
MKKKIAEQHIRWLDAIYRDMLDLLQTPLPSAHGQGPTTLWAVLCREVDPSTATEDILKSRLLELHKLLQQYCPAVAMYRDNVSKVWDAQIYQDRGARLLDRIKPFLAMFGNLSAIEFEFLDMHLRGETERKNPEALHRPTRT